MSLFKAREWWSTRVGDGEEFDFGCLCVANIDNHSNGNDKIIVGSFHGYVRVFQPKPYKLEGSGWSGYKAEDVMCELHVGLPCIQIEAGRFVSGSDALHLAVLHPRKLAVYSLVSVAGRAEHGNQYELKLMYEHKLQRTSYNFCCGPFGSVQGKDFICVQSMDGTLSVFEQESFAFSRFLPGALLPGPLRYLPRMDSFITVSSSRQVEAYKYQVLATASDAKTKEESQNMRSGKKVAADWIFNLGESALDISVFSMNTGTSIHILGERNLFVLTEGGRLKHMKKFDYNPSCFLPYATVLGETTNTLVATHTNTLMVYQDITLKWAAQLSHVPVQVKVANLHDLKGVMVILTEDGYLQCTYMGTDPSMFTPPSAEVRELDYAQLDQEMKSLQRQIKEKQSKNTINLPSSKQEDDLEILISVPTELDQNSHAEDVEFQDEDIVPSLTVKVTLKARIRLHDVKVSVSAPPPLVANETFVTYSSLDPSRPGETSVTFYVKENSLCAILLSDVTATYQGDSGAPRIVHSSIKLPLKLVMKAYPPVKNAMYKITIDTNKPPVNLNDIFPDLLGDNAGGQGNALGFKYYGLEPVVTVLASKTSQRYRLQSDQFESIWLVLDEFVKRLFGFNARNSVNDFKISYDGALPLQEYFEVLDKHFECRVHDEKFQQMLNERASQFRSIQRRLLTRFKDKTPSPLVNLDTLLDGTYRQLLALAEHTEENLRFQDKCAACLSAATRMLNLLIRFWQNLNDTEFSVLEHALSPNVYDNGKHGWEEMVDASVTNLLRTCLSKSSKDQTVNPAPLGMLQDTQKLKKHIALVCDRLSKGAKLQVEGHTASKSYFSAEAAMAAAPKSRSENKPPSSKQSTGPVPSLGDLSSAYGTSAPTPSSSSKGYGKTEDSNRYEDSKPSESQYKPTPGYELPALSNGDSEGLPELSARLPALTDPGGSSKYLKKKPEPADLVPDLDDMGGEEGDMMNGTNELVYDMDQLGL